MKGKAIKNIITTVGLPVLFGALIFTLWQTKVLHALFKTDEDNPSAADKNRLDHRR